MQPAELDAILTVLRKHGVASAEVPLPTFSGCLRIVFGPDASLPPGQELTPGGWKSPERLDADPLADERSVP